MASVRLDVPQSYVDEVNHGLNQINDHFISLNANDIGREALSVYRWAVEQVRLGRAVVSVNRDMDALVQIETPHLPAREPSV